ncbi:MAG: SCP2 sterol-binding domain-containing protein [Pseudomonadota bacterium]
MPDPTIQQVIDGMPSRYNPSAIKGLKAVLQFILSGDDPVKFHAIIDNEECKTADGVHDNPTLTLKMSSNTYLDLVMGRLTGQQAFFLRKMHMEGSMSLATKLHNVFIALK